MNQFPNQTNTTKVSGYPACDLSMAGSDAQTARARSLGFTRVRGVVCLKKLIDPKHRDAGDARSDAEYRRLSARGCPYVLGFDHPRLWRTETGELFATADEYHLGPHDCERLRAAERNLGVSVALSGMTMYAPGYTIMILVTAPGSSVSIDLGERQR